MPEVPRVETPFQEASIGELLRLELLSRRLDPHRDMAALMLAQIAVETARGHACQNYNVGNVTVLESSSAAYYRPKWFAEGQTDPHLRVLHDLMAHGQAPRAFAAFSSFTAGVSGYVTTAAHLAVVEAARTGDAEIMADVIRTGGYSPGAPSTLGHTLDQLRAEYLSRGLFDSLPLDRADSGPQDLEPLS